MLRRGSICPSRHESALEPTDSTPITEALMAAPSPTTRPPRLRPVFRNINVSDLVRYRLPVPGIVSILHRVSGALLFLFLWLILWLLQASVTDVARFQALYANPLVKLVVIALLWSLMHHLCAGIRFLVMDVSPNATDLKPGRQSAAVVLVVSILLTVLVGMKLW
jgi:succinate dehydrogenase / fumarate reductase cytochrome b subunit